MWKVNYHIVFKLNDGNIIKKKNSMNIKSSLVRSAKDAENYVLKKYKNSSQPLVNTDDIFISIINEKIIIESIEKLY